MIGLQMVGMPAYLSVWLPINRKHFHNFAIRMCTTSILSPIDAFHAISRATFHAADRSPFMQTDFLPGLSDRSPEQAGWPADRQAGTLICRNKRRNISDALIQKAILASYSFS